MSYTSDQNNVTLMTTFNMLLTTRYNTKSYFQCPGLIKQLLSTRYHYNDRKDSAKADN